MENKMKSCEFIESCPIFARFASEGSKNFWIQLYCQGERMNSCERLHLRRMGKEIPITLLPNGKHLESLATP